MVDFGALRRRVPSVPVHDGVVAALDRLAIAREAAAPFVAGEGVGDLVATVAETSAAGMAPSVEYLPADTADLTARLVHLQAISALAADDLGTGADLLVDLRVLGLGRAEDAAVRAELVATCTAATSAGMTVTIAGLPHGLVDRALALRGELAGDHPDLGVTIAANLHRSEGDCVDLASAGARVRLVRVTEPAGSGVGFTGGHDIDKAFVRCLRILTSDGAHTVVAVHDDRLIEIAGALAARSYHPERVVYQFARGVLRGRAEELVALGTPVSILVPFGPGWAEYVSTRLAMNPETLGQAVRAAGGLGGSA